MTIEVESTHMGDSQVDGPESIEELFLKRLTKDEETLSETDADENLETDSEEDEAVSGDEETLSEDDAAEGSDEDTEETETTKEPARKKITAADDDVIEVEGVEVSLRDLKRNFGRDKALTLKEQAASETKKRADEALNLYAGSLKRHYDKAVEAYRPYEGKNLSVIAMREGWDADTLETVMEQELAARTNLEYFHKELTELSGRREAENAARIKQEAFEAHAVLSNPETGIKGWSLETYVGLLRYAETDLGISPNVTQTLTDPTIIKALHKLHAYETAAKVGSTALETKTKKVAPTASKVLKSSAANKSEHSDHERAMRRLRSDNSSEAIQNAFMARLTNKR